MDATDTTVSQNTPGSSERSEETKSLGDVLGGALESSPPGKSLFADLVLGRIQLTDEDRARIDAAQRRDVEELRVSKCEDRLRAFFGATILDTDWTHKGLARDACEAVLRWQYGPVGLLLSGDSGHGKTRAMAALVRRLMVEERREVALWHAQELFSAITQQQNYGRDDAARFIDALGSTKLLVIEDLGQEATARNLDEVVRQWFFRMLDMRYSRGLPCLITTNHTAQSLAETGRALSADPLVRRLIAVAKPVDPAFPCARRHSTARGDKDNVVEFKQHK